MPYLRFAILSLLLAAGWPALAQVRRCAGPDGTTIFTDRRCQDIGAVERLPRSAASVSAPLYRNACSRNLQDLVYELTAAIDSRDVNRFAGVYYWVGMSSGTAYSIMGRLQAIVQRPLVDVSPVFAARADPDVDAAADDDYYAQTTIRRIPVGLRLEQTLSNGSTPSRTVLGLRKYFGCWWVQL